MYFMLQGEGRRPRTYIAAQGNTFPCHFDDNNAIQLCPAAPLQYTVCDMWRMVWEYRVRVIIMTTTLMEAGKEVNPYQLPANGNACSVNYVVCKH